jgi:S1-C subfamily serine protease
MSEKLKWALTVVVSMVLGAAAVVGLEGVASDDGGSGSTVIERVSSSDTSGVSTSINSVADLYDQVHESVVKINTSGSQGEGTGSGVVLDDDGHILTNNHVVASGGAIDVVLSDGTSASAEVVGRDTGNDLALIKTDLPADKLKPAKLGNSDDARVGDFVIAVGNPFDRDGTVTGGIVSGLGRTLAENGGRPLRQLIQSDAAINPGNSGGALINSRGEVIGITTAIENPSGGGVFAGIGYSVPINTATRFLPDLLAGRNVEHPRLGIGLEDVTPAIAESRGLSVDHGVQVVAVEQGSAAARAGLRGTRQSGDVIVAIDGKEINSFDDLAAYIDGKKVGDSVQVKVMRGSQEVTVPVTLEAWRSGSS